LLGLAALDVSWIVFAGAALAVVGGFAAIMAGPVALEVFSLLGAGVWLVVLLNLRGLRREWSSDDWFLLIWLGIEIVAYAAISPFAAAWRVMGLVLVMTVVMGRLAGRRKIAVRRPWRMWLIVAVSVVLGLGFYAVDFADALAQKNAVGQAAELIAPQRGETVWFTGHWELQFYAGQMGYQQVVPDHSLLRRGDWLVYPEITMSTQHIGIPADAIVQVGEVRIDDAVRLTAVNYYASIVPLGHRDGPRAWLGVYRITRDFIPPTTYSADVLVKWAATRGRPLPEDSITAVVAAVRRIDPEAADRSRAEGDTEASVRRAASAAATELH